MESDEIPSSKKPRIDSRHVEKQERPPGALEFPVRELEEFYKDCPAYRLPVELGCFSLDSCGKYVGDRSQLKSYAPPTKLNFDLSIGWSDFVPKKCSVPTSKLDPILRWIEHNGHQFLPKANPKSPTVLNEKTKVGDQQAVVGSPFSDDARFATCVTLPFGEWEVERSEGGGGVEGGGGKLHFYWSRSPHYPPVGGQTG